MKLRYFAFTIVLDGVMAMAVAAQNRKRVVFLSQQKIAIGTLSDGSDVRGKATFTVTAANSDDTLAGIFTYVIPDEARQKIAQLTGKQLTAVPSTFTVKDVVASFQKQTACPVVHIEVGPMEMDAAGAKVKFARKVVLDISGVEPGSIEKPTPDQEMAMVFCVWTKQINNAGIRRGPIRRMNELINGEDSGQ
jgi:hypothetical protein